VRPDVDAAPGRINGNVIATMTMAGLDTDIPHNVHTCQNRESHARENGKKQT